MLNFEYQNNGDSLAEYRGLKIRAVQDTDTENPWTDSDGFAPLLWTSGDSGLTEHGDAELERPLAAFSDYQISRKWRQLVAVLAPDCDAIALHKELAAARLDNAPQWRASLSDLKREALAERLADHAPDSRRSWPVDYLDLLAELWSLAGCESLSFQRNGYSQGDSVLGLLVATPAWIEAMGIDPKRPLADDLTGQADIFGAWAFGECYGFVIESPDGESLDSCWGFIGSDFEKSGLAEAATEAADSILESAAERRTEKLKELIRNRVPAMYRPALLAEAGKLESSYA
jgi:hypothetical protein